MKKTFMLLCLLVFNLSFGQVLDEQFDSNAGFTTSTPFFSDGFSDYFGLAVVNDYNGDATPNNLKAYSGFTGGYLAGMDLDGEGATLPISVSWTGLDISGLTALSFSGQFAEFFDSPGDIDAADFILVEYQIDGGGYQNLIAFEGTNFSSGTNNGVFAEDTNFDGTGDGTILTGTAQAFTKSIAGSGTTLDLRLTVSVNSGDEDFAVDTFQITGTPALGNPPVIACPGDIVVNNDTGICGAVVFFGDAIATDPDGDLDTVVQTGGMPNGSTFPVGDSIIEYTATDLNGNTATCQFTITVEDNENPVAMCQNITVELNPVTGMVSVNPGDIDNGSTDNCGIASMSLDVSTFDCSMVGTNTVTLTVIDAAGNTDTCTATVTVEDNTAPDIVCVGNTTGPSVFINEIHYDNTGGDQDEAIEVAGPAGTDLSTWSIILYNGSNGNEYNNVPLSGTIDDEGNGFGAVNFPISGIQNGAPDGIVLANNGAVVQFISYEGSFTANDGIAMGMTSVDIGVSESSGTNIGESLQLTGMGSASADFVWNNPMPSSPGDINAGQTFVAPTALPLDVVLDANGNASLPASTLLLNLDEACSYVVTVGGLTSVDFDCSMLGENLVDVTVTDASGNSSTCTATVNVIDDTTPIITCGPQDSGATILEEFEGSSVPAGWSTNIVSGSQDWTFGSGTMPGAADFPTNAAIFDDDAAGNTGDNNVAELLSPAYDLTGATSADLSFDYALGDFAGSGLLRVEVYDGTAWQEIFLADDVDIDPTNSGVIDVLPYANASFQVKFTYDDEDSGWNWGAGVDNFIFDYSIPPTSSNVIIELDENGEAVINPMDLISNVDEACGITTSAVDVTDVTCADIGTPIDVTVFVTDASGNLASCVATIEVVDNLAPVVTCPADQTVEIDAQNVLYEVPDYWANGDGSVLDNCTDPVTVFTQDPAPGSFLADGVYTVTLGAEDEYGNIGTCTFELTVVTVLGTTDNVLSSISMYPNPANDVFTITNGTGILLEKAAIYDVNGKLVNTINLQDMTTEKTIDVSALASGVYMVQISSNNATVVKRLIKK